MDPTLYYRVFREGVSLRIITEYYKSDGPWQLHHSDTDHIQGNKSETESRREAFIIKIN